MTKNRDQTKDTSQLTEGQDTKHSEEAGSFEENPNKGVTTGSTRGEDDRDGADDYASKILGRDHDGPTEEQKNMKTEDQVERATAGQRDTESKLQAREKDNDTRPGVK